MSSTDQALDRQQLPGEFNRVFDEKVSGAGRDRPQLERLLHTIEEGDEVVVWSIDRLARNLLDLQEIIREVVDKGASIEFVTERLRFSGDEEDAASKLQLHLMGAFAEFERTLIRKRQKEGIAAAKAAGKLTGRGPSIDRKALDDLFKRGHSAREAARIVGCGVASAYRIRKELGYETLHEITTIKKAKKAKKAGTEEAAS